MTISANFPNVKPSLLLDFANAQQLPPSVTFTRATTAVYYNGSTTSLADQNLIIYSQEFNSWQQERTTTTANSTTAPDGTSTADTIAASGAAQNHSVYHSNEITLTNGLTYTYSVYAKKNGSDFVQLTWYQSGFSNAYVNFDLNAGTVGTASGCTATITSVGSGWYRCTMTATCNFTTAGRFYLSLVTSSTSTQFEQFTATTQSIFAWGAQAEIRSAAGGYTVTTTQPITTYNPTQLTAGGGQPRFDHNPTTSESLGLLIEEQRTNLFSYSNIGDDTAFSAAYSVGPNAINFGSVVGLDGTLSARRYFSTASSNSYFQRNSITISTAGTYVFSVWVRLVAGSTPTNLSGFFSAFGQGVTMNAAPTSQWSRVFGTVTFASTGSSQFTMPFYDSPNGVTIDYFGPQLEAGTFPTSYIPTTTAAATRAADGVSMTGANFSSWFNAGEGTFYGEANLSGGGRYFHTVKTGSSAQIEGTQQTATFDAFVYTTDIQANIQIAAASFINRRVALAYQVNDIAACVSGGAVSADTNAILPLDLNAFYVNSYGTSGPLGSGTVKKVAYYPQRLTDAQLQALTS